MVLFGRARTSGGESGSEDGGASEAPWSVAGGGFVKAAAAAAAASRRQERLWKDAPYQRWARHGCSLLKYHLRNGCPPALRPDVWLHASGGAALAAAAPAPYPALARTGYASLARARAPGGAASAPHDAARPAAGAGGAYAPLGRESVRSAISGDAWIAIREESALPWQRDSGLPKGAAARLSARPDAPAALQRMLVALAARDPAAPGRLWRGVGAAAAFLLAIAEDEERAFWTLAGLADRLFGAGDFQGQHGVMVECHLLASLVKIRSPRVHAHLTDELEISPADLISPWISRCFVGSLGDLEATARVWDCLVFEGPKVLHRVGLALLALSESTVFSCAHPQALPRLLEARCAQALCGPGRGGALIGAAYKRSVVGGLPASLVAGLRAAAAEEVAGKLDERRRRLAALLA